MHSELPRYDRQRSYEWNYEHAPDIIELPIPDMPGSWTYCGLPTASPLGIPAGPLLNGRWCLYYAALGFDVLTYKTVRSSARNCYPLPNLQPVRCNMLTGQEQSVSATDNMLGSWAVSYGMPSADPAVWQADVEATRRALPSHKILTVSVVGSVQEGWSAKDLADDYADCARMAVDSGADVVEANLSCPNVSTCDGQLYQQPEAAGTVAAAVKQAVGAVPVVLKIGHLTNRSLARELLQSVSTTVDALAMTNSVATQVQRDDALLFDGQKRGICGMASRQASVQQVGLFTELIAELKQPLKLIGVGGIESAEDVREYLQAGAECCHLATSAMIRPTVALEIREQWARQPGK